MRRTITQCLVLVGILLFALISGAPVYADYVESTKTLDLWVGTTAGIPVGTSGDGSPYDYSSITKVQIADPSIIAPGKATDDLNNGPNPPAVAFTDKLYFKGLKEGTTTITITYADANGTHTMKVTVHVRKRGVGPSQTVSVKDKND